MHLPTTKDLLLNGVRQLTFGQEANFLIMDFLSKVRIHNITREVYITFDYKWMKQTIEEEIMPMFNITDIQINFTDKENELEFRYTDHKYLRSQFKVIK